jgi:broad specificity phosphatase PhoE
MALLLVRHAKAGDRGSWHGRDRDRPLSGKGRRQAEGLVDLLGDWKPSRIVSSPFVRCVETVAPLADTVGVPIETSDVLAEGARTRDVLRFIDESLGTDGDVVLCTHGDVVPMALETLVERDGLDLPADYAYAKGSTWVLEGEPGRVTSARYLPPPA